MRCCFCRGQKNMHTIALDMAPGENFITMNNASASFARGDLIFVCNENGSGLEFLGPITMIDDDGLQTLRSMEYEHDAGAIFWTPEEHFSWTTKRALPARSERDNGISTRVSAGGVFHLTKVREPVIHETVKFSGLRIRDIYHFDSWFEDALLGGLRPFTFCDEDAQIFRAAYLSSQITRDKNTPGNLSLEISLCLSGPGEYR